LAAVGRDHYPKGIDVVEQCEVDEGLVQEGFEAPESGLFLENEEQMNQATNVCSDSDFKV